MFGNIQPHPYILPLLVGAAILLLVAVLVWRRRVNIAEKPFAALMLAQVIWLVAYAFELSSTSRDSVLFWFNIKLIGMVLVVALWLIFVLAYAGHRKWLAWPLIGLLLAEPLLALLLGWTNNAHNLLWGDIAMVANGDYLIAVPAYNAGFFLHAAVSWCFGLVSVVVLLRMFRHAAPLYRSQIGLLLLGWALPAVTSAFTMYSRGNPAAVDLTPFAFALSSLVITWNLYGFRFLDVSPVAYDHVFDGMDHGVIVLDNRNRIVNINAAAVDLVQPLTLESVGKPVADVFSTLSVQLQPYLDANDLNTTLDMELEDGSHTFELKITPLTDRQGNFSGRVIVLDDITEKLVNQEQLHKLSLAVEQSGSLIFITDQDGAIEYANPKFEEVTGYKLEEVYRQTPRILKSGDAPSAVYRDLWKTIKAGLPWRGEFHNRRKNGEMYWALATIAPIQNRDGEVTHFVAIEEDITELKAITEQEHQQRILAEALFDNSAMINSTLDMDEVLDRVLVNMRRVVTAPYDAASILLLDDAGIARVVNYWDHQNDLHNPDWMNDLCFNVEETRNLREVARSGDPLIIPDVRDYPGWRTLESGRHARSVMTVPVHFQGALIGFLSLQSAVQDAFAPAHSEQLKPFAVQVGIAISNARTYATVERYASELESRNRELDAFSHTVAHDLRSPLALIIGYLGLLVEDRALEGEYLSYLEQAKNAADRMNGMIDSLLLLAQLGSADEVLEVVNMEQVVQAALVRLHMDIAARNIDVQAMPDLLPVVGYGPWLEEVLANLIGNAIKYIGQDNAAPRISIACVREGDRVRYEVVDNGVGISPEVQEQLFEMFSRFHHQEAKGFGLGLSIVQRIITLLNGELGVESTLGEGSTFWFTLPAVHVQPER